MKAHPFHLIRLAFAALITFPAFVLAAPADTTPYYTDVTHSYVYDQVTEDMFALNGFLCLMSAMAPNLMVNNGDYIALIDAQSCFVGGSGGQSSNKGKEYLPVQLNSSRTSNSAPMLVKMWIDFQDVFVPLYASASQAPSTQLPYGVFRIDGCLKLPTDASCEGKIGYIDASKSGLAFYFLIKGNNNDFNELALQLSASSSANSGSGILIKNQMSSNVLTPTATLFAYSPDYFYRSDGTVSKCFNRSLIYAQESAWRYGLYDAVTGEHLVHPSGFPIEYTYTSANTSGTGTVGTIYNGYISYYGLSMQYGTTSAQVKVPTGETVYQITYDTNPPTKKPYTLINSGGKLTKYTTTTKNLSILHKLPVWYWSRSITPVVSGSLLATGMIASKYYEIYWDDTSKNFVVSGEYNSSTGSMEPLIQVSPVLNTAMVTAANGYGLNGWSQLLGGSFSIKGTDFALLDTSTNKSAIPVITQTQDVVYPKDFAAINNAGGLKCIGDCPTAAQIVLHNANTTVTPFISPGWGPFATLGNYTYRLDSLTGNLLDTTGAPVIQTTTSAIYSGKLVTATDMASILLLKPSCATGGACYSQSDVDLLTNPVYYVWQTSSDSWNQMGFLTDPATNTQVTFYPPLPVSFAVPNTSTYGSLAGSTITLQYGDFGNLWGIPNKCIDLTTNAECNFTGTATPSANQHWAPRFSIPFNTTEGYVTSGVAQGPIAQNTQFLVKALDKEIRLAEVPVNICTALGLTKPIAANTLPSSKYWSNPTPKIGSKPVLNPPPAPQIIDGVKQY